jgi:5-methyltetrahydrofolate--homocysteine methyltransferase
LDVNVGLPDIDEVDMLTRAVCELQAVCDVPLQIDTANPVAMEAALRRVNGKPLVNSVNGKEESLRAVLPLVARYGGAVVALALDESGIPETVEGRLAVVRKILARGAEYGLRPADFVVDVLCLAVSSDAQSARVVLEAVRRVREELGCRTVLGVSNISFGLPARPLLNSTFYTLAMGAGLSAAIINPLSRDMMTAYRAYRALTGLDRHCEAWIAQAPDVASPASPAVESVASDVRQAIRRGLQDDAAAAVRAARAAGRDALALVDGEIVPALEETGRAFEQGTLFLPQLLMAAEAARAAFETVREALPADAAAARGPILIATVKGDIHDIGKNIVRTLWENYGYRVIDLGRDVPPERIVEAVRREKVKLVGLSALMTTTVGAMAETIRQIRAADLPARVVVGGAVLTEAYARTIGADYYARDAMAAVRVAEEVFA